MKHLQPYLEELVEREKPGFSKNLHLPNELKMAPFKAAKKTCWQMEGEEGKASATKVVESIPFDIKGLLDSPGRLMVKLSSIWQVPNDALSCSLMGASFTLQRFKYLTDAQRAAMSKEKEVATGKRAREEIKPKAKKVKRPTTPSPEEETEAESDAE